MKNNVSSGGREFNYVVRNYGASQAAIDKTMAERAAAEQKAADERAAKEAAANPPAAPAEVVVESFSFTP